MKQECFYKDQVQTCTEVALSFRSLLLSISGNILLFYILGKAFLSPSSLLSYAEFLWDPRKRKEEDCIFDSVNLFMTHLSQSLSHINNMLSPKTFLGTHWFSLFVLLHIFWAEQKATLGAVNSSWSVVGKQ